MSRLDDYCKATRPNKALHTTPRLRLGLKVSVHWRGVCELCRYATTAIDSFDAHW